MFGIQERVGFCLVPGFLMSVNLQVYDTSFGKRRQPVRINMWLARHTLVNPCRYDGHMQLASHWSAHLLICLGQIRRAVYRQLLGKMAGGGE